MGYFRIETGHNSLGIEGSVVWATPASWTEKNTACFESGSNCQAHEFWTNEFYVDPSTHYLKADNSKLRGQKITSSS